MAQHSDDDLRLFHPFYSVMIGFGLLQLGNAIFEGWLHASDGTYSWQRELIVIVLAGGLIGVALRLTWSVESFSRFLAAKRKVGEDVSHRVTALWRFPVLLVQALLILITLRAASLVAEPTQDLVEASVRVFSCLGILLALNALFLLSVLPSKKACDATDESGRHYDSRDSKIVWIVNNTICALAIGGLLLGAPSVAESTRVAPLFVVLIANSVIDLVATAEHYVPRK